MILKDKVILVTGGSGLIGRAIIDDIIGNGGIPINLDINVETNLEKGEIHFDLTSDESIAEVIDNVLPIYRRIDGLVNNAYPRTDDWGNVFENVTNNSFSANLEMQLGRIFAICKPILSQMKSQSSGSVVHIASIYGMVGSDFTVYKNTTLTSPAAYSAIKGGLINFSRYLASYFGGSGIRSNCVSPGGIFDNQNEIFVKQYEDKVPMKRMGKPVDIAPIVSFLLSDKASYITGQNIAVDGGWTAI